MDEIIPLPMILYQRAKQLNIKEIAIQWSGGSDEGYLEVEFDVDDYSQQTRDFVGEVESWATESYSYNGAGDGASYGDNYIYDLVKNKVRHDEWYMEPTTHIGEEMHLSVGADWIEDIDLQSSLIE